MSRVWSLLIGYVCGNFLTAEVVSRRISGKSLFERGSGNPGMTNIAAQDGVKSAALVLAGDLIKTFLPCLLCRIVLFPEAGTTAAAYAGLGAVLGHNFPIWHRFKGGKGVSCTCAALVSISFGYGLLACVVGEIGILVSHYLPIGAVLIPVAFLLPAFCLYGNEVGILTVVMTLIMLQRHMPGLKNIPTGTEPRKDFLKKLKGKKNQQRYEVKEMGLRDRAKRLKSDIPAIFIALKDKDTPLIAKLFAGITVGYALSPIDLIPDFIPVLGYLDDVILLPALAALTIRCIPKDVWDRSKQSAEGLWADGKPKKWYYAIPIIVFWLIILWLIVKAICF